MPILFVHYSFRRVHATYIIVNKNGIEVYWCTEKGHHTRAHSHTDTDAWAGTKWSLDSIACLFHIQSKTVPEKADCVCALMTDSHRIVAMFSSQIPKVSSCGGNASASASTGGSGSRCARTPMQVYVFTIIGASVCVRFYACVPKSARDVGVFERMKIFYFGVEPVVSNCLPAQYCVDSGTQNTRANLAYGQWLCVSCVSLLTSKIKMK